MIPILYKSNETEFVSNGLGRLYDATDCIVTEERNGIYELQFSYPITGINFSKIVPGSIVGVVHNETNTIQPFDIVSYSRPIDGVVSFFGVHISYRLNNIVASGTNINSLQDAIELLATGQPTNPFSFETNFVSPGYMAAADGIPRTVRSLIGGVEGSILDTYGGELLFDKFDVNLLKARGKRSDYTIRYGVNLTQYDEDADYSEAYSAAVPYWSGPDANNNPVLVKGGLVPTGLKMHTGRVTAVPLNLTDKFKNPPTAAQLEALALNLMRDNQTNLPQRTININFLSISNALDYEEVTALENCNLCDSVNVVFPRYNIYGNFKIVKTVYDVLRERFQSFELGSLSPSLADSLGIKNTL